MATKRKRKEAEAGNVVTAPAVEADLVPVPVKPARKRTYTPSFSEEELGRIESLSRKLNGASGSEIIRRGLIALEKEVDGGLETRPELALSGDTETVKRKGVALKVFRYLGNTAAAAHEAGVTGRTVLYWLENDPVFAQLAADGKNRAVSAVKMKLYAKAMEGNISAMFGILNNEDPEFGQIRSAMVELHARKFLDHVMSAAKRVLPKDLLERLADEIEAKPIEGFFGKIR